MESSSAQRRVSAYADLAVEVISPGDTLQDVEEKVDDYINAGCPMVLVLNPKRRTATVYRPARQPMVLREDETFDGRTLFRVFGARSERSLHDGNRLMSGVGTTSRGITCRSSKDLPTPVGAACVLALFFSGIATLTFPLGLATVLFGDVGDPVQRATFHDPALGKWVLAEALTAWALCIAVLCGSIMALKRIELGRRILVVAAFVALTMMFVDFVGQVLWLPRIIESVRANLKWPLNVIYAHRVSLSLLVGIPTATCVLAFAWYMMRPATKAAFQ